MIENLKEELENLKQLPGEAHTKAACKLRAYPSYSPYIRQLKDDTLKLSKQAIRDEERYEASNDLKIFGC